MWCPPHQVRDWQPRAPLLLDAVLFAVGVQGNRHPRQGVRCQDRPPSRSVRRASPKRAPVVVLGGFRERCDGARREPRRAAFPSSPPILTLLPFSAPLSSLLSPRLNPSVLLPRQASVAYHSTSAARRRERQGRATLCPRRCRCQCRTKHSFQGPCCIAATRADGTRWMSRQSRSRSRCIQTSTHRWQGPSSCAGMTSKRRRMVRRHRLRLREGVLHSRAAVLLQTAALLFKTSKTLKLRASRPLRPPPQALPPPQASLPRRP